MRLISKKWGGRRGAALVLALMFFLLCACVSTMVVTAAAANAGKAAKMREEEQNYLAVKAAANTVAQMMKNSTYTAGYTEQYTRIYTVTTATDGSISDKEDLRSVLLKDSVNGLSTFTGTNPPMAALLENGNRNDILSIYLNNTTLHDGRGTPVLKMTLGGAGGTPGVWAVALGPEEYKLTLEVSDYSDVKPVSVTLKIDRGTSSTGSNLYEATILAVSKDGSHKVELYCQPELTEAQQIINDDTATTTERNKTITTTTVDTNYSLTIEWKTWLVKRSAGGSA